MRARAGGSDAARSSAHEHPRQRGGELRSGLTGRYGRVPRSIGLKASEPFRNLQERISGIETALADRRRSYNDAVNTNNVRIDRYRMC